jgi:thiol:disulfide interchange protein
MKNMDDTEKEKFEETERLRLENERQTRRQIKKEKREKIETKNKHPKKGKIKVNSEIVERKTLPSLIHLAASDSLADAGLLIPDLDSGLSLALNPCVSPMFFDSLLDLPPRPQSMLIAEGHPFIPTAPLSSPFP